MFAFIVGLSLIAATPLLDGADAADFLVVEAPRPEVTLPNGLVLVEFYEARVGPPAEMQATIKGLMANGYSVVQAERRRERCPLAEKYGVKDFPSYGLFYKQKIVAYCKGVPSFEKFKDFYKVAFNSVYAESVKDKQPVLLAFTAKWCQPCKQLYNPIFGLQAQGYPVRFVDVDEEQVIAQQYGVTQVPTLIMLDGEGKAQEVTVGVTEELRKAPKERLKDLFFRRNK